MLDKIRDPGFTHVIQERDALLMLVRVICTKDNKAERFTVVRCRCQDRSLDGALDGCRVHAFVREVADGAPPRHSTAGALTYRFRCAQWEEVLVQWANDIACLLT